MGDRLSEVLAASMPAIRAVEWVQAVTGVRLPVADCIRLHPGGHGFAPGLLVSGGPGALGLASSLCADVGARWQSIRWPRGRVARMAPPLRGDVLLVSGIGGMLAAYRAGASLLSPVWVAPSPRDMLDFRPPDGVERVLIWPSADVDGRVTIIRRGRVCPNPHYGKRTWIEAADRLAWVIGERADFVDGVP